MCEPLYARLLLGPGIYTRYALGCQQRHTIMSYLQDEPDLLIRFYYPQWARERRKDLRTVEVIQMVIYQGVKTEIPLYKVL